MSGHRIKIIGPEAGCAILACLLLVASPMSGGQPGRPLRAELVSAPPVVPSGQPLQGEVALPDQQSGRSLSTYALNVGLVGRNPILNRGLNGNLGWVDDCAYVSAYYGGTHPFA